MQIQPSGAAFFRPARAIETRGYYALATPRQQLRGLGDTDVGATIGAVAGAAGNAISAIFGAQSSQANAAANAAIANSNERIAMAQLADAAETRKTYLMVGAGIAAIAVLGFALK